MKTHEKSRYEWKIKCCHEESEHKGVWDLMALIFVIQLGLNQYINGCWPGLMCVC